METIDARGLACPTPVVKAKKALKQYNEFEILISSDVAKENVSRFLEAQKAHIAVEEIPDGFKITVKK